MQLLSLVILAVASCASATPVSQDAEAAVPQQPGVTFYELTYYSGYSYEVTSFGQCSRLPRRLSLKAASVYFKNRAVSCIVFKNRQCTPERLNDGLQQSFPDLRAIRLNDKIASVICTPDA
ncbi:hypothetical protein LMH87_010479 [Akanthomyces muscarius]|uniref:Uncharacterized protein n=1 Tax=Akanthomyces muscarius TaxID=2231603 RepID=A0A9W8UN07_AKAMU|nr:hypothetical protein LMH87_010479 [Akanthomyces muscarius]KAJ4154015.1 hypothetical protein LMH87_010479 [Akanthomyces muscarius]